GIPASFVVHDDWLSYGRQHDQWMRMWRGRRRLLVPIVERALGVPTAVDLTSAGPFVFNSRYTLEQARRAGIDTPEMAVVYPGIDERFLAPLPPLPWRYQLAYVGRVDRQKGIDTAVLALAHLPPDATLAVWGTGDERYVGEMKSLAADLGIGER